MSKLGIIVGVTGSAGLGMAMEHLLGTFERHAAQRILDDGLVILDMESMKMDPYDRAVYYTSVKRGLENRDLHKSRRKPSVADELKIRFGH